LLELFAKWLDQQEYNSYYLKHIRNTAQDPFKDEKLKIEELFESKDSIKTISN
jgi:hypothetical protein